MTDLYCSQINLGIRYIYFRLSSANKQISYRAECNNKPGLGQLYDLIKFGIERALANYWSVRWLVSGLISPAGAGLL